mgnify:CR=1 FL=1
MRRCARHADAKSFVGRRGRAVRFNEWSPGSCGGDSVRGARRAARGRQRAGRGRLPCPPCLACAPRLRLTATCAPVLPLSSLARLQGWAPASGQPFEAVAVLGAGGAPPLTNDVPGLRWSAGHLAGFARAVRRRRVRDAGAVVVPPMRPVCAGLACGLPPGVGGRVGGSALGCDAHGPI